MRHTGDGKYYLVMPACTVISLGSSSSCTPAFNLAIKMNVIIIPPLGFSAAMHELTAWR